MTIPEQHNYPHKKLSQEISNRLDGKYTVDEIKGFLATRFTCPQEVLDALEDIKSNYKLITINDILKLFLKELDSRPDFAEWVTSQTDILVVDEAQDLSLLNFEIFNRLLKAKKELGMIELACIGIFSNGEAVYNKVA